MNNLIHQAYQPETFRQQGHQLIDQMADYLKNMQHDPAIAVLPWQHPEERLFSFEADYAQAPNQQINQFFGQVMAQSMHIHHPKYVGHQVCPPLPVSVLAGMVSGLLNNGMAVYEMGPVSSVLERLVMKEVATAMGYDGEAGGIMTSGGTLSNLTALLAARQAKAKNWQKGTQGQLALMVSSEAHYCIDRAVKVMGWGEEGIIKVPGNTSYSMDTSQLESCLARAHQEGKQVIAVVGSACTTSTGSYDNLKAIGDFCQRHQLWFHVDGAHGAPVAFSEKYKSLVSGIELADSITIDFHKMMLTPALTTGLLFKDEKKSYQTFSQQAAYLLNEQDGEWFNSGKRTFECTKRMMSLQVYSILRTYGKDIFQQNIDYLFDLSQTFSQMLEEHPLFELAMPPQANIICFRLAPPQVSVKELSSLNLKVRQEMLEDGEFYLVQTMLNGEVYLRTTLMNPFTTRDILAQLLNKIVRVGHELM